MENGLRFGRFELDLDAQELRRAGQLVKLQPRPFRILALLASRSGSLVTREEIRQHVWGSDTWVDFDHNVSFCLHQIRVALNDRGPAPRFVETLPRRGYRFVAAVEPAASTHALASLPVLQKPSYRSGGRWAAVAALALLTTGVAVGWEQPRPAAAVPTSAAEAAYLKGLYLHKSGSARLEAAARAFEDAVRLDPARAEAHAALAEAYVEIVDLGLRPARATLALAEGQAREALRLDPSRASAHVALGTAGSQAPGTGRALARASRARSSLMTGSSQPTPPGPPTSPHAVTTMARSPRFGGRRPSIPSVPSCGAMRAGTTTAHGASGTRQPSGKRPSPLTRAKPAATSAWSAPIATRHGSTRRSKKHARRCALPASPMCSAWI